MGQPYYDAVGEPPHLGSGEFKTWCENLINHRWGYCNGARSTTYYVASGGAFGNTGLTQLDPIPFHKIPSLLGSDREFLLKRGDEFIYNSGLATSASHTNIRFAEYGDSQLPKPMISAFTLRYPSGTQWIALPGTTQTFYLSGIAPSAPISWIREYPSEIQRLSPFRYRSTLAGVNSSPNSFSYFAASGGVVIFNCSGIPPSNRNIEMVMDNQLAIELAGDMTAWNNIDVHGFGCNTSIGATSYGIIMRSSGNAVIAVSGAEVYYAGRHNFAMLGPGGASAAGGIGLFTHCKAGYPNDQAREGYSHWVGYSSQGDHEYILNSCETKFGALPDDINLPGSGDSYIQAGLQVNTGNIYAHTSNKTTKSRLILIYDHQTTASSGYQGATTANGICFFDPNNTPGIESDISTYRSFVVNYRSILPFGQSMAFPPRVAFINSRWQTRLETAGTNDATIAAGSASGGGIYINCIWDYYMGRVAAVARQTLIKSDTNPTTMKFRNCRISFTDTINSASNNYWGVMSDDAGSSGVGITIANTIITRSGAKPAVVGTINAPTALLHNAFYNIVSSGENRILGFEPGYDATGNNSVTLVGAYPPLLGVPSSGSQLYASGSLAPFDFTLGYDYNWNRRAPSFMSIGPFQEAYSPPGGGGGPDVVLIIDPTRPTRVGGIVTFLGGGFGTKSMGPSVDPAGYSERLNNRFDDYTYYKKPD